jgi:7-carboxy-7-deazaguanine synthase
MRQQIIPMLHRFAEQGWMTQIETAGTVWPPFAWVSKPTADGPTDEGMPPGRFVTLDELIAQRSVELVCSPKTPKIHAKIEQHCDHYKYIVRAGDICEDTGLPIANTQTGEHSPKRLWAPYPDNVLPTIWLQPMTEYYPVRGDGQYGATEPGQKPLEDTRRTRRNIEECVRLSMKHGHRISLQQHRILEVD